MKPLEWLAPLNIDTAKDTEDILCPMVFVLCLLPSEILNGDKHAKYGL